METAQENLIQALETMQENIFILTILFVVFLLFMVAILVNVLFNEAVRVFIEELVKEKSWLVRIWTTSFAIFFVTTILLSLSGVQSFLSPNKLETANILAVAGVLAGLYDLYARGSTGKALRISRFFLWYGITAVLLGIISWFLGGYHLITDNLKDTYALLTIALILLSKLANNYYDKLQGKKHKKEIERLTTENSNLKSEIDDLKNQLEECNKDPNKTI